MQLTKDYDLSNIVHWDQRGKFLKFEPKKKNKKGVKKTTTTKKRMGEASMTKS